LLAQWSALSTALATFLEGETLESQVQLLAGFASRLEDLAQVLARGSYFLFGGSSLLLAYQPSRPSSSLAAAAGPPPDGDGSLSPSPTSVSRA